MKREGEQGSIAKRWSRRTRNPVEASSDRRKVEAREAQREAARRNSGKPREHRKVGSRDGSEPRKGSVTGVGRKLRGYRPGGDLGDVGSAGKLVLAAGIRVRWQVRECQAAEQSVRGSCRRLVCR